MTDIGDEGRRRIAEEIGATLNEDLYPLVEEWDEVEYTSNGVRGAYWSCAGQLKDVIEGTEDHWKTRRE